MFLSFGYVGVLVKSLKNLRKNEREELSFDFISHNISTIEFHLKRKAGIIGPTEHI